MADKTLTHGQKGKFHDLKSEAVDPSNIDTDEFIKAPNGGFTTTPNPRFNKPRFLSWTLKESDDGYVKTEYWEAIGLDGKVYRVTNSTPRVEKEDTGEVTIV